MLEVKSLKIKIIAYPPNVKAFVNLERKMKAEK